MTPRGTRRCYVLERPYSSPPSEIYYTEDETRFKAAMSRQPLVIKNKLPPNCSPTSQLGIKRVPLDYTDFERTIPAQQQPE